MELKPLRFLRLAIACSFFAAGCERSGDLAALPAGQTVTVQFRRDALGAAASLPIPPLSEAINGATTAVTGTLVRTAGKWIVIRQGQTDVWIPQSSILLIELAVPR